ncbi:type II toxin-antitoxin system HicA family toxin [Candidatus Uhrbacteria bacterium]|nr:type II toxin-antitoxin system HicA family toxin [Candidatus Uhrbacteria bacterium]
MEDRRKGSHLVLYHPQTGDRTVVPIHEGRTMKKGLFFGILKDALFTVDEFSKEL